MSPFPANMGFSRNHILRDIAPPGPCLQGRCQYSCTGDSAGSELFVDESMTTTSPCSGKSYTRGILYLLAQPMSMPVWCTRDRPMFTLALAACYTSSGMSAQSLLDAKVHMLLQRAQAIPGVFKTAAVPTFSCVCQTARGSRDDTTLSANSEHVLLAGMCSSKRGHTQGYGPDASPVIRSLSLSF